MVAKKLVGGDEFTKAVVIKLYSVNHSNDVN